MLAAVIAAFPLSANAAATLVTVTITGQPVTQRPLEATPVVSGGTATGITYQWYKKTASQTSWTAISGATSSIYTPKVTDVGYNISVTATMAGTTKQSGATNYKVVLLGDVTKDGSITQTDVSYIQQYVARTKTLDKQQMVIADVYWDNAVNMKDVTKLSQYIAGSISTL